MALARPAQFRIRVGVDITVVERISRLVTLYPASRERLFTARELDYCLGRRRRYEHLAGRFAAKEAVMKAFGIGVGRGVRWTDIEITNGPDGRPLVQLTGRLASIAEEEGLADLDVSVSHVKELAIAHVVSLWSS